MCLEDQLSLLEKFVAGTGSPSGIVPVLKEKVASDNSPGFARRLLVGPRIW